MKLQQLIYRSPITRVVPADRNICAAAVCISLLLSLWASFSDGIINLDGILYVSVAERLAHGDLSGAAQLYNWFFYPLCIAGVSKVFGLAFDVSAYLLTALFSALLTYAFISCVRILGGTGKVLLWAAFVIVFHPVFMEARSEIIRDHGYWSFYLLSVLFFLRFYEKATLRNAFWWGINMVVATLFRIEGLLFLLMLPMVLLFQRGLPWSRRRSFFVKSYLVNLLLLLVIFVFKIADPSLNILEHGRLGDALFLGEKFYAALTGGLAGKAEILEKWVLFPYSEKYAMPALVMIPFMILADKLLGTMTLLYAGFLAWHPLRYVRSLKREFVPVLVWLVFLNFSLLIIFLFADYFIQKRFVFPLGMILLLPLPFILDRHFEIWKAAKQNSFKTSWLVYLFVFILLLQSLDGLVTVPGHSKYFIKDAGLWLKDNIPAQASLYTNNPKIYYYSGHMSGYWENRPARIKLSLELLKEKPWQDKTYIALWKTRHCIQTDNEISASIGSQPIKTFSNGRQEKVLIYTSR